MTPRRQNTPQVKRTLGMVLPVGLSVLLCLLAAVFAQQAESDQDDSDLPAAVPMAWLRTSPAIADDTIRQAIAKGSAFLSGRQLADDTVLAHSLRVMRTLADRPAADVADDVAWLIDQQQAGGGWGFGPGHVHTQTYPDWSDLANTQLAVAALRMSVDAGSDVPVEVFDLAHQYCLDSQNDDGGWGFSPPDAQPLRLRGATHGSMTAAALNILFDCQPAGDVDSSVHLQPVVKGLRWLLDNYDVRQVPDWQWNDDDQTMVKYLWLLGRMAAAGGVRNLGPHNVRDDVVGQLLSMQNPDGSWGADDTAFVDTALAVAALSRARRPVLINRLAVDVDYGIDTINWIRHVNATADQPVTWQRIGSSVPPAVLAEAPILLIVTNDDIDFPEPIPALLLRFLEDGGTIIVQVSRQYEDSVPRAASYFDAMLPAWYAKPLSEFSAALSASAAVGPEVAEGAIGIGDNVRLAVIILPGNIYDDLTAGPGEETAETFGLMTNLAVIASGASQPVGRLPYVAHEPPISFRPALGVPVARVWHSGDWHVCPHAFDRISEAMAGAVSIGASELRAEDLYEGPPSSQLLLWMTGTEPTKLTRVQRNNLLLYLQDGGMLVIDSAIGGEDFIYVAEAMLANMFAGAPLERLPADHPLLTGEFGGGIGNDLTSVTYREAVTDPPAGAELYGITIDGRLAVIVSRYGVLAAAEGGPVVGDRSLSTDDARRLAANVLLYALTGGR